MDSVEHHSPCGNRRHAALGELPARIRASLVAFLKFPQPHRASEGLASTFGEASFPHDWLRSRLGLTEARHRAHPGSARANDKLAHRVVIQASHRLARCLHQPGCQRFLISVRRPPHRKVPGVGRDGRFPLSHRLQNARNCCLSPLTEPFVVLHGTGQRIVRVGLTQKQQEKKLEGIGSNSYVAFLPWARKEALFLPLFLLAFLLLCSFPTVLFCSSLLNNAIYRSFARDCIVAYIPYHRTFQDYITFPSFFYSKYR